MSKQSSPDACSNSNQEVEPRQGPNLVLVYSLVGLAILAALFIAGLIVMPFYHRR